MIKNLFILVTVLMTLSVIGCQNTQSQQTITPAPYFPTGPWYTVEGRGSTKMGAIGDAWRRAMRNFVAANVDSDHFHANQDQIGIFISKNWKKYVVGDHDNPVLVQKYYRRKIVIQVQLREEELLHDIYQL